MQMMTSQNVTHCKIHADIVHRIQQAETRK